MAQAHSLNSSPISVPPLQDTPVSVFNNDQFGDIRVLTGADGSPWFMAKDVCLALGFERPTDAVKYLDEDEKGVTINHTPGGPQEMLIISEPGLYSLILRSRKPEAKAFKRWVTHDILPSIRKHGIYATPHTVESLISDPDMIIQLATTLKQERQERQALEAQAALDRPKIVFADSIEVAKTSILVGELAKLINQSTGYDIGQNRMFAYLRENGYLHKRGSQTNMPTQRSIDAGWMEIKEGTRIGSSGEAHITKTPKITGRGQIYFVNLFKNLQEHGGAE